MTNLPEPTDLLPGELPAELAIKTQTQGQLSLDHVADKIAGIKECQNMIAFWTERLNALKAEIADALGDSEVGMVGGREAVVFEYKNQFNGTAFAKAYPDMARLYTRPVTKETLDIEALKTFQPELYHQFQVRAMRVTWKPPGDPS